MTRTGTNEIDLWPQVLDVGDDIGYVDVVKLDFPGFRVAGDLLHVSDVVRLADRRRSKDREDVDERASYCCRPLVHKSL